MESLDLIISGFYFGSWFFFESSMDISLLEYLVDIFISTEWFLVGFNNKVFNIFSLFVIVVDNFLNIVVKLVLFVDTCRDYSLEIFDFGVKLRLLAFDFFKYFLVLRDGALKTKEFRFD